MDIFPSDPSKLLISTDKQAEVGTIKTLVWSVVEAELEKQAGMYYDEICKIRLAVPHIDLCICAWCLMREHFWNWQQNSLSGQNCGH
jgi:hypothetical protein